MISSMESFPSPDESRDEQQVPPAPEAHEKKFNNEEEVKKAEEKYDQRVEAVCQEIIKAAKDLGFSSPAEFENRYFQLEDKMRAAEERAKGKDIKPEEIFSAKDALVYRYGQEFARYGKEMAKDQQEILVALSYRKGLEKPDAHTQGGVDGVFNKDTGEKIYDAHATEQVEKEPLVEVSREGITKAEMEDMGLILSGNQLRLTRDGNYSSIDLYGKGDNARFDFQKIDDRKILMICTEKGGRVIEYTIEDGCFLPDSRKVRPPEK